MFNICFHKWTKWEQYEESGKKQLTYDGFPIGESSKYKELREKCICLKCGKFKDRFIRDLPA